MKIDILNGDCLDMMATLPDESVDMCVTSPPYWGLRDYGGEGRVWGNHLCIRDDDTYVNHEWEGYTRPSENTRNNNNSLQLKSAYWEPQEQAFCKHCDSWFGQLGLEPTPEQYVKNMVKIFSEVKRVLKPEGTLWLNLGDSYCAGSRKTSTPQSMHDGEERNLPQNQRNQASGNLKGKDLVGIPWMVAFALRADGWYLRQDIIWAKPNCMPESVKDRCTKNHEYIFLLSKSKDYFYDNEAIKEDTVTKADKNKSAFAYSDNEDWAKDKDASRISKAKGISEARTKNYAKRNKRSVWWVGPKPFPEAHFAVFPIELVEPCILAGTSAHGCCSECGAPWVRNIKRSGGPNTEERIARVMEETGLSRKAASAYSVSGSEWKKHKAENPDVFMGWKATCDCDADVKPAVVFDPFGGSGTTGIVAIKHGRSAILTELSEKYVEIAEARIASFRAEAGMDKEGVEWL